MDENVKIPMHIGIIMDGNRRWAKKRGLIPQLGHKEGADNLIKVAEACSEFGIKYLTVFAFMVHINHFLYFISLIIDYFISKKITIISKIGALLEVVNMGIIPLYLHMIDRNNKKGWKFNK